MRMSVADGLEAAYKNVQDNLRFYPLSTAGSSPELEMVSLSGQSFNTVHANDFHFYEELNAVVQREPAAFFPRETRGLWASIGIEKGKPFEPDARVTFHYPHTAVTPAMEKPRPGVGSDYRIAYLDEAGEPFDGSKIYKVTMPANPPLEDFWTFTLYDTQTRSMLQTDQPQPSIDSIQNDPTMNGDSSSEVYFAPAAPEGWEGNWVQTIPGKSWFTILRMYWPKEE